MRHYEEEQWVDYARGVSDPDSARELQSHLESGCDECRVELEMFETVAAVAARKVEHQPPARALRSVEAYFSLRQTEREPALSRLLALNLAFDSFAEPARVGIRGPEGTSRQLVYYGNDYALTLRLDYDDELSLGGELLRRDVGPVPNVPAVLLSGEEVVGYSLSGELGDFRLSCARESPLRLRMLVDDDGLIELELDWPEAFGPS